MLSSPAKLSIKNNNLIIETDTEHKVPIEDINSILIESQTTTLSTYLLDNIAQNNICLFICDKKHMPSAVLIPYNQHYQKPKIFEAQIEVSKPIKKNIWRDIIIQKIKNQATVVQMIHGNTDEYKNILILSKKVNSGDTSNMEAVAASKYFRALFGEQFHRESKTDDAINSALNYGYAIVRGLTARTLVSYGFECCMGLHHHNYYNSFNLADDIMEIFRPCIDLYVAKNLEIFARGLDTNAKKHLYNIINFDVLSNGEKHPMSYAIELMVMSLQGVYLKQKEKIRLFEVIPQKLHQYE